MTTLLRLIPLLLAIGLGACATTPSPELPAACQTDCRSPYGIELGRSDSGIVAYSNCSNACVVIKPHFQSGTFTGIEWQCVEYARRWLLSEYGVVYGSVDFASDIWEQVQEYRRVADDSRIAVDSRLNGHTEPPARGDLLIYGKALYGTGHVAVVTQVDLVQGVVRVAEQNYRNTPWPTNHAREIPLHRHGDGYWLLDPHLIGWKHLATTINKSAAQ